MTSSQSVHLTPREVEVLCAMTDGDTSYEIGERLAISSNTVNFHLKNIFRKLHLGSRAQVAVWAAWNGYGGSSDN